jgi:Ni/Co efflux regulator RcnB
LIKRSGVHADHFQKSRKVMRNLLIAASAAALVAGAANAQPFQHADWAQDQGAQHHWNSGDRMGYNDWAGAQPVDYRAHHLRRPPHGYAWRESNGQFILAAVATGVVASIILDNAR